MTTCCILHAIYYILNIKKNSQYAIGSQYTDTLPKMHLAETSSDSEIYFHFIRQHMHQVLIMMLQCIALWETLAIQDIVDLFIYFLHNADFA